MEITSLGHASFRVRTYVQSHGWVTIITDPYDSKMVGLRFPKLDADIVTLSHQHEDHNAIGEVKIGEGTKVLEGPGEYEIKGITLRGIATKHDDKNGEERGENTVFVIDTEGIRLAHLGDLGHSLKDAELSEIGTVDIVFVPVGGVYTIDAEKAAEVVGELEPKVVIPMHYKIPGMGPTFDKLETVDEFIKEIGLEPKRQEKYEIKKNGFAEEMELVVLERKG